jgi:hypothetical protein
VEYVNAAFARQWHGEHKSAALDIHTAIEVLEAMFSVLSMLRLYINLWVS